jgi:hypothetical protein
MPPDLSALYKMSQDLLVIYLNCFPIGKVFSISLKVRATYNVHFIS